MGERIRKISMKKLLVLSLFALAVTFSLPAPGFAQEHEHQHHEVDSSRDRDRYMWQQPERVMNAIGIEPGMVVADVGAGNGYFTVRLARRVGPQGKVYAEDIDERGLRRIKELVAQDGLKNVEVIKGKADDPLLPEKAVDLALMVNVFHFIEKPKEFFDNLRTSLKPGATLVVVQWDSEKISIETEMSPSDLDLYSKKKLLKTMKDVGYEVVRIESFLSVQNIYICRP
jgi:ubiquinone/menaquinone biosynthesis C-methylase UbiE